MLKTLFAEYKWHILAALFVIYSVGGWNIATTYNDSSWTKKELQRTEKFLDNQKHNDELKTFISKALQEALANQQKEAAKATKDLIDEIAKDPRYKSCTTTDGVRAALQRKLNNQSP